MAEGKQQRFVPAHRNLEFLEGEDGDLIRIQCELIEPRSRLQRENVHRTIVFFGSARSRTMVQACERLERAERDANEAPGDEEARTALRRAKRGLEMARYGEQAEELAARLTHWSKTLPDEEQLDICTGGGPGIMQAANKGAFEAGGRSIGFNIKVPHEQRPNDYITPGLGFEFGSFMMRKYWFVTLARAFISFPGGIGTLDELFEIITLIKTGKARSMPVVLFGKDYWERLLDLDVMLEHGTIDEDIKAICHTVDSVDAAFEYVTRGLLQSVEADS